MNKRGVGAIWGLEELQFVASSQVFRAPLEKHFAKEPCQRNPKCNDILAATSFALYINLGCKMYHGFLKCFMSSQLDPRTKKSHYVGPQSTTNSHLGS